MSALGARVMRIGFAPGDRLYWDTRAGPYRAYRGAAEAFGATLRDLVEEQGVTDVVMLGDGRIYHRLAIEALRHLERPVTPWIVEQGYLRGGLFRVEIGGTGGNSPIPGAFSGQDVPECPAPDPAGASFLRYAALDVVYHATNLVAGPVLYPRYRHHALDSTLAEWRGWIGKALTARGRARATQAGLDRIAAHHGPVFLLPLQLDTDFQLRTYGTGRSQGEEIDAIIACFAAESRQDALLVVKEHPLDNGRRLWGGKVGACALRRGVAERVVFLPGGRVECLFPRLAGVVTINSTVGLSALLEGVPVKVLGRAVYDCAGLTHQGSFAELFRGDAEVPDSDLAARFRRFLRYHFHVPGAFDGPDAIKGGQNLARCIAGEMPL